MKTCIGCNVSKNDEDFRKSRSKCKLCEKKYNEEYHKKNPNKKKEMWKAYSNENKVQLLEHQKEYYIENPEKAVEKSKKYAENNRDKINKTRRNNYNNGDNKLKNKYRKETHKLLTSKNVKHSQLIGCSSEFFRSWITSLFTPLMSMRTYGTVWELDHIVPVSLFNLQNEIHVKLCYSWENVRPCLCSVNKHKTNYLFLDQILIQELKCYNYKKSFQKCLLPPINKNISWGTRLMAVRPSVDAMQCIAPNGKNVNNRDNPQPSS